MKELQQAILDSTSKLIESGQMEAMIEKHLTSLVDEQIRSSLRSYGTFGKEITTRIDAALGTALAHIKLPEYNQFIAGCVQDAFVKVLDENALKHMTSLVADVIKPIEKETTDGKIAQRVLELWSDDLRHAGSYEILLEREENSSGVHIRFGHPSYEDDSIEVTLYNHGEQPGFWHIGYIAEGKKRMTGSVGGVTYGKVNSVASYLFLLWASRTSIKGSFEDFGDALSLGD